ncbi:S-layer homology domain-containing protein [Paenibacillus sp. FSL W7-1287]|uniref:S-layer homology domain-containing protein n=1 Tax=Paenibacillus sp. FSL W7-1287 TaxID=2954538 RepID=UPI0030FA1B1E
MKQKAISIIASVSLFFSLLLQAVSPVVVSADEAGSSALLVNPGFESELINNEIHGWSIDSSVVGNGTIEISTAYAKSGTQSLLFEDTNNKSSGARFRVLSNEITAQENDKVTFDVHVYKAEAKDQSHGIQPVIFYYDAAGNTTKTNDFVQYGAAAVPVGSWHKLTVTGVVPQNTAYIKVGLYSGDVSLTKVYMDDAHVVIESEQPEPPTPTASPEPTSPSVPSEIPSTDLINADLESELVNDTILGWSIDSGLEGNGSMSISTAYAKSGTQSLLFEDTNNASSGARFRVLSNAITVQENDTVTFDVHVYKAEAKDQSHGIQPVIYYYDAAGNTTKTNDFVQYAATAVPVGIWQKLTVTGVVPADTAYIKVGLYSGDISLTKVYMDDAAISIDPEIPTPTYHDMIFNPGFEEDLVNGVIPGWSLAAGTEGTIELNEQIVKSGSSSLYFKDSNNEKNTRVISEPFAIEGGKTIIAEASVYVISQTHNIVLEFYYYDENGVQLGFNQTLFSSNTLGSNKWSVMKLQTDVPANAVSARIGFNSGEISLTEAYFDDISTMTLAEEEPLDRQYQAPVDLGDMVYVNLGQAAAIQSNANGENEVYFITNGDPGTFYAVDLETGKYLFSEVIPHTEATWAITIGEDKNVYFSGTGDGILYRYLPTEKRIEKLGYNTADNWVWDLEMIDDKVYGGTYNPSTDGKVFEYNTTTGQFRNYGVVGTGQNYVRGIAVDEQYIYAALGTTIELKKIDRVTGEITEVIVPGYSGNTGTAGDVYLINDKIFFSSSTQNMVVIDKETLEIDKTFLHQAMISEPDPNDSNLIYYVYAKKMYQYDMEAKTITLVELPYDLPDTPRYKDFAWITLNSGEKANETVLAVITQYGETMLIDPESGWIKYINLEIAANSVSIQAMEHGPDGRIYMGGYQRGMSIYNPFTDGIDVNIPNFAQPEGIGFMNDYVYYGTYVSAVMYKYDPKQEAEMNVNPSLVFDIEHQDRPFAITSGDNKLFVGTVPDYGYLGGALAIYDEATDTWEQYNHEQFAINQSVMSLAYRNGLLFGGTTVWGGLGINPTEEEAVIFAWDTERNEVVKQIKLSELGLSIDETPRMIGSISFGPDGLLWGVVDGTIFALNVDDINSPEIVKSKMIFPSLYNTSKWLAYELEWAPDGMIYTTLGRKLIALDPDTLQFKVLDETFTNEMTIGIDGSIYYAPGAKTFMYRIAIPETDATLSALAVNGTPIANFSPGVLTYEVATKEQLEITATATQSGAIVEIINNEDGSASVYVTGTDGKSSLIYRISAVDPVDPTPTPTPKPNPDNNNGSGEGDHTGVQQVTDSELLSPVDGIVTIKLGEGKSEAVFPRQASKLLKSDVQIQGAQGNILLTKEALAQFEAASDGAFALNLLQAKVKAEEFAGAYGATISAASTPIKLEFKSKQTDGNEVSIDFIQDVQLQLNIDHEANKDLTAIYQVLSDGSLVYVGGTIKDGVITAAITAPGTYIALTFDKQYDDVPENHWAFAAIQQASLQLVAQGVNTSQFAPNESITREEFVTLIVRALGLELKDSETKFADVALDSSYATYIAAAHKAGLINGKGNDSFDPRSTISREEMAVVLLRAYQHANGEASAAAQHSFADEHEMSHWAKANISLAYELGLIQGLGNNRFAPQAELTRAEATQAIMNLLLNE